MASGEVHQDFVRVFDVHVEAIRGYCLRRLPVGEANDALAEVFVVAWRRREDMPEGAELRLWLFGVARNVVRTVQRGNRRISRLASRIAEQPKESAPGPEGEVIERSGHVVVRRALAQLREDDREVLMLKAWEGLTAQEIAVAVGISLAAAEKRLSRALARLRPMLDMEDGE